MIDMEKVAEPKDNSWHEDAIHHDEAELDDSISSQENAWQIGAGAAIMGAGVIVPAISIAVGAAFSFEGIWRLTLLHPLETMIESLLLLSVPYANYSAWHSLCHNDLRHPIRTGILNGIAIAVPLMTFAIAITSFALHYPLIDSINKQPHDLSVGLMGLVSLPALATAIYLTRCLRQAKQTRDAKFRTILYSLLGIGLTLISFLGAEARSTYIRIAENMSLSDAPKEREAGLSMLRGANPEKELKIICADPHAAGLSGMFLPLDADAQKRLFFAATGKPYRDSQNTNMSLMSNDYLRNHVVGEAIEGLSLHRSAIHGFLHPETLTSTLNWTFVFKNKTYMNQEARAELALPEGAVISNLTLWVNGKPQSGAFSANENAGSHYQFINVQHQDPALITDLGRGRYLLQASPVPGQGELKVQVTVTEPLKLDGANNASVGMPRFIDKNFALNGEHAITLRSAQKMTSGVKTIRSTNSADGVNMLVGKLNEENISNSAFTVKLEKPVEFKTIAVSDPFTSTARKIVEQLKTRSANAPRHLMVVIDSSQAMDGKVKDVIAAIKSIPSQIDTKIMLAGDKENGEAVSREEGIKILENNKFG
ncbi:MAG: hypothetical protein K2X27_07580, partial [Candidatus Obscuribacterales bacterium]|nr:hypothetical protein [Candidatus Obscuribacterales bacterium]